MDAAKQSLAASVRGYNGTATSVNVFSTVYHRQGSCGARGSPV
jgi:hypothetical protein